MFEQVRKIPVPSIVGVVVIAAAAYSLYQNPPLRAIERGEVGLRANRLTGDVSESTDGSMVVLPLVHELRVLPLRDQVYRPAQSARADGPAPFQSLEGLSIGIDVAVRYAIDRARLKALNYALTESFAADVVEPAVQGVVYKTFARYTVREIFSTKRADIQQSIEKELAARLAADGLALRSVVIGKVDLPADYRRGMEALLAEELASEKMRYTAQLREQRAEAAAREQVIAAKGQEEAMKHVLPFKQRQVEQRKLEAEADRIARMRRADGNAEARKIEAAGEAHARQKLAEAEAYRLEKVGKANAEQMEREGALVSRHPLLIQKTLADKLSDKIQVIIAPAPADNQFIGATLLGKSKP